MTEEYQEGTVQRTFALYQPQIREAIDQLNREYAGLFDKPLRIREDGGITCNFVQAMLLEQKVIQLTNDPEARLMRPIARFEANADSASLTCHKGPLNLPALDMEPRYSDPALGVRPAKREK
ncbi:hypothetical protein HYT51_00275 [Candidatus Woesearchaeota archaeon]|nr:hypothetical protein [Candidatus Woesearchaeota archaeon]